MVDVSKDRAADLTEVYGKLDSVLGIDTEEQVQVEVSSGQPGKDEAPPPDDKPDDKAPVIEKKPEPKEKPFGDKEAADKYPSLARTIKILAEREAAVERAEKAAKAPVSNQSMMMDFKRDPAAALAKIGFSEVQAQQILRIGIAKQLGDKAPDQYKKLLETTSQDVRHDETTQEIENLKAEIKRRDMEAANNAYVTHYQNEVSTFLEGAEKDAPLVYRMFATKKDKAVARVMTKVREDAQTKIAAGKRDAQPMSAAEAALLVEADLEELRGVFGSDTKTVSNSGTKQGNGAVNLSNKSTRPAGQAAGNEVELPFSQHVDAYMKSKGL